MKRILLLFIACLPLLTLAQVQQPPTTGNYNVSSSQVTLYRNGTGIDANLRIFGGSTYGYFDVPTLRKIYTRFQADSAITSRGYAVLNGGNTFSGNQKINDIRPLDVNSYSYGLTDYVNATDYVSGARSGYGFHNFGIVGMKLYTNARNDLLHMRVDDGNDYTVWHSGNLPLGAPGQSVRVNSSGTAFEAYTPGATAAPTLQSVTNAGNTTTTRISAAGFDVSGTGGNGYFQLPSQSVSPASSTGNLRIYSDSLNRLSWKNSIYRRTLQVPFLSDVTIRFPFKSNPILADSTNVDNIYYKKSGGTLTGDATIEYNGTPSLNLSNNVSGSKTTLSQSATNNKFSLNVSARPAGGIGGALSLSSASSQSVTMANSIPTGAAPFSIGGWVQRTGGTNRFVFANASTTAGQQLFLQTASGGGYILTHSNTSFVGSPSDAQYFHFFYVFNGTQGKLFINGVISGGVLTVSSPNVGSGTLILGRSALNAQFGDYNIDQFVVYSSALTDAQVVAIYNMGAGTPSIPTLNLVRRFDFETSGTLLLDGVSGTNATGTNSPAYTPAGKVALSTAGALAVNEILTTKDGQTQAEPIIVNVGGETFTQTVNLNGRFNGIQTSKGYSLQGGPNGWLAFANGLIDNRDINGNTALYGMTFYPGNSTTEGHQHWISANTLPNPSTARIGVHTWSGGRMNVITSSTTTSQYAYTSDLTQIVEIPTGTTAQQASANTIYIPHATTKTTITLPLDANAPVGTLIQVVGEGSGGWRIGQNASQFIVGIGTFSTTVGTAGYVESSEANCTITLRKTLTNKWTITSSQGTINRN